MSNAFNACSRTNHHWLRAWFRERIVPGWWWLGPLSVAISVIGGSRDSLVRSIAAMVSLVAFRLFDDLSDVLHDRQHHPERSLCQLDSFSQAYLVCAFGLLFSTFLIFILGENATIFPFALFFIALATRLRQNGSGGMRIVYAHVILLKFPALAIALASNDVELTGLWSHAALLYGFVGIYEVLHDADARRSKWTRIMFGFDMVCLTLGLTYCASSCLGGRGE